MSETIFEHGTISRDDFAAPGVNPGSRNGRFPSFKWPRIAAAMDSSTEAGAKALGDLLMEYRTALAGYLETKFFYDPHQAEDLVAEFILHLIKNNLLARFRRIQGADFNKFVICLLHTFAISQHRRKTTLKRRPAKGFTSLDDLPEQEAPYVDRELWNVLDLEWARNVLAEALGRMKNDCAANNRRDIWGIFEHRLLKPIFEGEKPQPYSALVREFNLSSPAQAHNLLITAKRSCARFILQVTGEYTAAKKNREPVLEELECIFSAAA